jgi:hypothetical protein
MGTRTVQKALMTGLFSAVAWMPVSRAAVAAPVEQDIDALAGQWQGETQGGTKVTLTVAKGAGDLLASGALKVDGGVAPQDVEFTLLRSEKLYFMVPGKTLFDGGEEAYTMSRLPQGGFKFTRLDRPEADSVQSDELEIGRLTHAGVRTLRIIRGEKYCKDGASVEGKVCGEAVSEQVTLHKQGA